MLLEAFQTAVRAAYRALGAVGFEVGTNGARLRGFHLGRKAPTRHAPVILLHGLGDTSTTWYRVVRPVAARRHLTLVDLPGHGLSSLPTTDTFWTPSRKATAVIDVLEDVADGPVTLVGQSLGGWVAMHVALQRPDLVERLVLVSTAGVLHPVAGRARALLSPSNVDDVLELWGHLWHRMPSGSRLLARDSLPKYSAAITADFLQHTPIDEMLGPAQLRKLTMPTLVVWGADDRLLPLETPGLVRDHAPEVSVTWLQKCGHLPQLERPVALARRILDFSD